MANHHGIIHLLNETITTKDNHLPKTSEPLLELEGNARLLLTSSEILLRLVEDIEIVLLPQAELEGVAMEKEATTTAVIRQRTVMNVGVEEEEVGAVI